MCLGPWLRGLNEFASLGTMSYSGSPLTPVQSSNLTFVASRLYPPVRLAANPNGALHRQLGRGIVVIWYEEPSVAVVTPKHPRSECGHLCRRLQSPLSRLSLTAGLDPHGTQVFSGSTDWHSPV